VTRCIVHCVAHNTTISPSPARYPVSRAERRDEGFDAYGGDCTPAIRGRVAWESALLIGSSSSQDIGEIQWIGRMLA
jgi:hypothetical protein